MVSLLVLPGSIIVVSRSKTTPEHVSPLDEDNEKQKNDARDDQNGDHHPFDTHLRSPGCDGENKRSAKGISDDGHANQSIPNYLSKWLDFLSMKESMKIMKLTS